ncbi:5-(carboxyamino)imidazole ribonucleotide mutase [Candidatus Gottesmanbacteria bacterium CG11_big_fil_rev_8_21_14_0_20_37_11]|uniref:N5-carboxyaminoimidazole ribonucleotide mutase n=2 Tax=Candidatus Gottesmaniibacteriota TaxID=1752720 RepID=A0A2M7RQB7_9BACT|nr:MAG: 5-(carboxyamino)imidazole ribonucleotide mutase [Candidatus Gottesmanbacteria bacterium CG23_combo_of_CG06-09_8_20_14_all_37_19]PIR08864.1 MAG: 5-(carboxyamino)imidazole ribonucleotide mutase [Candidatus Gottesmanbacteria bacterium CG11_big_fil_rev_8_21_14_0_20_37_11]PIZ02521.1 MAG: 5-(carboxyamino)imidazole ribonucleotide mutase [Candidatus Gottesmanbacteria bacterium CG_4_10_14_0_8_um_filter_37_24]
MVIIILGSKSDLNLAKEIIKNLQFFKIEYRLHIASAHKNPEYVLGLLKKYEAEGKEKIYICVAGRSNALGGVVDAQILSPVINCPPYSEKFAGLDILSSLRMPSGVCSMTVLEPEQAVLAAAKILALKDEEIRNRIKLYRKEYKDMMVRENGKLSESSII